VEGPSQLEGQAAEAARKQSQKAEVVPLHEAEVVPLRAAERRSLWGRLRSEVRSRPMAYGVLAVFVLAGPVVARLLFPEAPPAVGIVGGLVFGAYAAMCAVPQKFL